MRKYVAVDIGGTAVKAGLIDEQGHILRQLTVEVNDGGRRYPLNEKTVEAVCRLRQQIEEEGDVVDAVGVSATGQIDRRSGRVIGTCGNIPGWIGTDLKALMFQQFPVKISVANDANCAMLGESWLGAGQGCDDLVAYTIGTGIGGGILCGGRLLDGCSGLGGELGHMIIERGGRPCTCGNKGCFEQYGSMTALVKQAMAITGLKQLDGRRIFQLVDYPEADEQLYAKQLCELIEGWLESHAVAIVSLVHIFNPQKVIIGGGVSKQGQRLIKPLSAKVMEHLMPRFAEKLMITPASLGNQAGMVGATRLAMMES